MFKFNPLLKSILWGGEKIVPFKRRRKLGNFRC